MLSSEDIRLLQLEGSDDEDTPIVASLKVVSLGSNPSYFALSYTWGEPTFNYSIICNGTSFPVTGNLYLALRRLRRCENKVLWIDQICINQSSVTERSDQVGFMYSIYQKAEQICVWLGPHQENTGLGIHLAHQLASSVELLSDKEKDFNLPSDGELFREAAVNSFHQLFESPWFQRCWVVQEVLAKPNPIAFYGDFQFNWRTLPFALIAMYTNPSFLMHLIGKIRRSELANRGQSCCLSMGFEFGNLVKDLRMDDSIANTTMGRTIRAQFDTIDFFLGASNLLSTDPRDKVYAFLGLSQGIHESLKPDYTLTVEETYYNFNKSLIMQGLGKSLVATAGLARREIESLPSWCLDPSFVKKDDWEGTSLFQLGKVYRLHLQAGSASAGKYFIGPESSELTVMGVRVDKIKELGPARKSIPGTATVTAMLYWLRDARKFLADLKSIAATRYPSWEERFQCFCRLVIADESRFSETAVSSHLDFVRSQVDLYTYAHQKDNRTVFQKIQDFEWKQEMKEYGELFGITTMGRRICVTERGYLGLVHNMTEVGDEICVVLGCDVPLTMREVLAGKERRVLIGNAFVLDLMNGQALSMENLSVQEIVLK